MKPVEATMTTKGQLTAPASLRETPGLKAGDKLVFKQDAAGRILVEARTDAFSDLRGIVTADACDAVMPVDGTRIAGWIDEARGGRWLRTQGTQKGKDEQA